MNKYLVLYTADLHGNETQYKKLVNFAIKNSMGAVIIGGDLTPKDPIDIEKQKRFIEKDLPRLLSPLKQKLPGSKLFLMMGNDDCMANIDMLKNYDPTLWSLINGNRLNLSDDFDIVGYSYVPITPFGLKDWEKFDLSKVSRDFKIEYELRKKFCRFKGSKTDNNGWHTFEFIPEMEKIDSIQKDLEARLFTINPQKTLYVLHSPPNKSNLDQIKTGHAGSFAVREFIEQKKPYVTLHGHIHETVSLSGKFYDQIGKTSCFSPGNNATDNYLSAVMFDLYNLKTAKRLKL
ncbi:MAG: metallophosphoesterase [Candidatus Pacearchaeota archaeon]|nr:metallophosphoesterase [Candidatus Pacearchaeota archaeon]